ncbi:MAG: hypothetical protein ACJ8AU_06880 [Gemmatimonadales bacterium]
MTPALRRIACGLALAVAAQGPATTPLEAQNPDLALTPAERDSVLANYHNVFPLLGRKAIERGFDLPKPFGINAVGVWVKQGIDIDDIGLSTGDDPVQPADFIQFGDNTSTVTTANLRADLWVLPFLNVYGMGGVARANTTVKLTEPIPFTSSVDQTGNYLGVGLTGAFGIKRFFTVVDVNWAWTNLEKLDEPVTSRVLSMRLGRAFKVGRANRIQAWLGTMNVKFKSETNGSILLVDAIPPETLEQIRGQLETVGDESWYQQLPPAQRVVVDQLVDRLLSGDYSDATVNYRLEKAPSTPWNMLVGGNFDLGKTWSFRAEVGFIGRYSVLLNTVYRLNF